MSLPSETGIRDEERRVHGAAAGRQHVPLDEWWKRLDATPEGLSEKAAHERLMRYGLNRIVERQQTPILKLFTLFGGSITWLIEIAGSLSILAHRTVDFIVMVGMLLAGAVGSFWQGARATKAAQALKKQLAPKARVKRAGKWREVDAAHLVPGDIVRLRIGDIFPADVVLVRGDNLRVDQSPLTGEPQPVEKRSQEIGYSGSVVLHGEMEALVTHTGSHTHLGKTAKLVSSSENASRFQKAVSSIGNYLIYVTLGLSALLFLLMLLRGSSEGTLLQLGLIVVTAAIPVAVPAALSLTTAPATRRVSGERATVIDVPRTRNTVKLVRNELT